MDGRWRCTLARARFAVLAEQFMRDLKLDRSRVDVSGGVIALGHPIGATGGMAPAVLIEQL